MAMQRAARVEGGEAASADRQRAECRAPEELTEQREGAPDAPAAPEEPQPDTSDLVTVAAPAINELSIVHDLRRAIDITPSFGPAYPDGPLRMVKFETVDRVLTGLSPSQIAIVKAEYKRQVGADRDLADDLLRDKNELPSRGDDLEALARAFFGGDRSALAGYSLEGAKFKSSLNRAQRARVRALLAGTALETSGTTSLTIAAPGSTDAPVELEAQCAAKVIARNRAVAEAAQLKLLIDANSEASRRRIMVILRKSAAANDWIAAAFESEFGKSLEPALAGLGGLAGERALALRYGRWQRADALAIEALRRRIVEIEQKKLRPFADRGALARERKKLVAEIEQVLADMADEAAAVLGGASSDVARKIVGEQLTAALAMRVSDGGETVGELLRGTLGAEELRVVDALQTADPVEAAAARLAQADAQGDMSTKLVVDSLRGLRLRAEQDVRSELRAKAAELASSGLEGDALEAATLELLQDAEQQVSRRAHLYVARLTTRIDQIADQPGEGHRRFADIVESAEAANTELMYKLVAQGGKLSALEDLQAAMRQKDLAAAFQVLRALPLEERREVVREYDARAKTTLAQEVSGKEVTIFSGKKVKLPRTDQEAAIAELISAPEPGGEAEFGWTYAWTRDTYERALHEGGLTGEIADVGGREVRELLDHSARTVTDAHILYRQATAPEERDEALRQLRNARAAITGDKAAYVEETNAMRATLASALAMVVDVALTMMMPASAGLIARLSASLIANIGSKVIVLQDKYSVEMLKEDLVGAVVSAGFAKPGSFVGQQATRLVGRKLASTAERIGLKVSPELASLAPAVTRLGGEIGESVGTTVIANKALGKDWHEGLGESVFLDLSIGYGTAAFKTARRRPSAEAAPAGDGPPAATTISAHEEATPVAAVPVGEPETAPKRLDEPEPEEIRVSMALEEPPRKRREVNKHVIRRPAAPPAPAAPVAPARPQPGEDPARVATPRAPETVPPPRQAGTPAGAVVQAADPHDPVEAWKLYRQHIAADPGREVALLYNYALDQWAVVQGSAAFVPTNEVRKLGWDPKDTTLARHSHPVEAGGRTSDPNLLPSGRGADVEIVRGDAAKGGTPQTNIHVIDVITAKGPDRTFVIFNPQTNRWTVDYPREAARSGRERISFATYAQYHDWFRRQFGFEPGAPLPHPQGPSEPIEPQAPKGSARHPLEERYGVELRRHPELRAELERIKKLPPGARRTAEEARLASWLKAAALERRQAQIAALAERRRHEEVGLTDVGETESRLLDLPEYQLAVEEASHAFASLPDIENPKNLAIDPGGTIAKSGRAGEKAELAERALMEGMEAGHETTPHRHDWGGPEGWYESSHSERHKAQGTDEQVFASSKPVCPACQAYFSYRARSQGRPQFIGDPTGVHVFFPNGAHAVVPHPSRG